MATKPKTTNGEIEANPAPKYEDVSGPQRVGADTGTAYPIPDDGSNPPPKESVIETPGEEPVVRSASGKKKS